MKFQHLLIVGFFLVILTGCLKEETVLEKNNEPERNSISDDRSDPAALSTNTCGCSEYVNYEGTYPVYESIEDFYEAYECLINCVDQHNENLSEEYSDLSEDDYDDLFEEGQLNEWEPYISFKQGLEGRTLFEKNQEVLDNWLDQDELDWSTYPLDELSPLSTTFNTMVNENCQAIIDGELVNICDDLELEEDFSRGLEWCTPYGYSTGQRTQGNRRVVLRGGIGKILFTTSFIFAKIENYKRRNGRWRRTRDRLCLSTTCSVRRSPLNSCDLLYKETSGVKCRNNRSSLSVSKFNFSDPFQIWFKRTRNSGPDGSAWGHNNHFSILVPY